MKLWKRSILTGLAIAVLGGALLLMAGVLTIQNPLTIGSQKETRSMLLLERVEEVRALATVRFHYQEILEHSDILDVAGLELPFGLGEKKILISYRAYLNGGCDLLSVEETGENGVSVVLGKGRVMDNVLVLDSLRIYDVQNGLFNRFEIDDDTKLVDADMKRYEEEVRAEVAEAAETNAKQMLEGFLLSLGYDAVSVTVR